MLQLHGGTSGHAPNRTDPGGRMSFDVVCQQAWWANQELFRAGLVSLTFGNASAIDRANGVLAIKPSGVPAATLTVEDIVVVSIGTGEVVAGRYRPSSDTPSH